MSVSTLYNQYIVAQVFVGETGHTHVRQDDPRAPEAPTAIDCVVCEPFLVKEGWVYSPDLVTLTEQQVRNQERATREGTQAVRWAAEALAAGAPAAFAAANRRVAEEEPQQVVVMTAPAEKGTDIVTPAPSVKQPAAEGRRKPGPKPGTFTPKNRQPAAVE